MKFSKLRQLVLVSSIGLFVATLLTACQIVTVDYLFVASNAGIETYAVDSESGVLRTGAAPVTSGLSTPVAMTVTSDYANLYVANQGNNTVVHYAIASNGVLTVKDTITTSTTPVYLATNATNSYLYVVSGSSSATLTEYALSSGAIGSAVSTQTLTLPGYTSDTIIPTGVTVMANNDAVFVTAYDQTVYNPGGTTSASDNANPGWVFGFAIGSGGTLTASLGSPYQAGVKPTAIVADPTNRFVYVTDWASNEIIGYSIHSGSMLSFLTNGPFKTAAEPSALTIDPRGKFIYVANSSSSVVTAYSIDLGTGTPTANMGLTSSANNSTDTWPVAVVVDPALGRFVYTANYLGNSVSGFRLDPTAGTLVTTQATPYPTGKNPTALVCVPHGNHSVQAITQ
jgi:6-phosphogluconolactonase (cycloisomerase 2 family)